MSELLLSLQPPPGWEERSLARHHLFLTDGWQQVLRRGLGATPVYLDWPELEQGLVLSVFRRGPFAVGYLGFPYLPPLVTRDHLRAVLAAVDVGQLPLRADLLRLPVSRFVVAERLDLPAAATAETAIADLPSWTAAECGNLEKDLRHARRRADRLGLEVVAGAEAGWAERAHDLYAETVRRHQGRLRYSPAYFDELLRLAGETSDLRFLAARAGGLVVGYAVVARAGEHACYVHAAVDQGWKQHGISDLLLAEGVAWSQEWGATLFNLMSSPAAAVSLIGFKEKWGGETRQMPTYQRALSLRGRLLELLLR